AVRSGVTPKAVSYLRQAGEKAAARTATREAIAYFDEALRVLSELPETREHLSESLDVLIAIGPAQIALAGATSPQVAATYERALELVGRLGDVPRRFPVIWGLWFISYTLGRYPAAREAGQKLLEEAQRSDDSGRLLEAHHAAWPTLLAMGETAA